MDVTRRKKDLSTNTTHEAAMDDFLKNLGLYRKPIAKDGSCLFRAVAEQIFNCQAEHTRVRKECIEFMKKNKDRFEAFVEGPFDHHLFNLKSQKEWAGQVEIQAISLMYKCDFFVYQDIDCAPIKATENNYDTKIMLCYSNGNHYDTIYPFSYQKNLGLCQSIVFELLYGKVLPFLAARDPVKKSSDSFEPGDKRRETNNPVDNTLTNGYASDNNTEESEEGWTKVKSRKQGKASVKNPKNSSEFHPDQARTSPVSANSSKLYWEIMRSIDPDGYRNIELEVWEQTRKEQQQKDQTVAAAIQFKKGDKCQAKHPEDSRYYTAFIDEIFEKNCKIWIPELKERKVLPFSSLKPNEPGSYSNYRDLSGYHRKQDVSAETGSRGNDEQRTGKRRKSNRNRKGNANENVERYQQDGQEDQSGRQRGDKNRRRRSGNPRPREERKESRSQGEGAGTSQEQGVLEISESSFPAFPSLPGSDIQHDTGKPKAEKDGDSNPAAFWSKLTTTPSPNEVTAFSRPLSKVSTAAEEASAPVESDKTFVDEATVGQANSVEAEGNQTNVLEEKLEYWENLSKMAEEYSSNMAEELENSDIDGFVESSESSHRPATSLNMVNGVNENNPAAEDHLEDTPDENEAYGEVNGVAFCNMPTGNIEILKNTARQEAQQERLSSTTGYEAPDEPQKATVSEDTNTIKTDDFLMVKPGMTENQASLAKDRKEDDQRDDVLPPGVRPRHNHQPVDAVAVQNEIFSGNITFSTDPEGKDLPKDIEILRHLYNRGVQTYLCYSGINASFPGGAPLSPIYPMMSPGAVYSTMHQPFQSQPMLYQPNMCQYPMQTVPQEETQQQQNPVEEQRDSSCSPGYKPSMSPHQSPQHSSQYHQAMAAQAMFNMNYGQMYATAGHRPMYSNYGVFPQRANYGRFPSNKFSSNRPPNRKIHRYQKVESQPSVKLYTGQSGYASDSKGGE